MVLREVKLICHILKRIMKSLGENNLHEAIGVLNRTENNFNVFLFDWEGLQAIGDVDVSIQRRKVTAVRRDFI